MGIFFEAIAIVAVIYGLTMCSMDLQKTRTENKCADFCESMDAHVQACDINNKVCSCSK